MKKILLALALMLGLAGCTVPVNQGYYDDSPIVVVHHHVVTHHVIVHHSYTRSYRRH